MNNITPFWEAESFDKIPKREIRVNNKVRPVNMPLSKKLDQSLRMEPLEQAMQTMVLKDGMSYVNTFFFSIKKHLADKESYKNFRKILDEHKLIRRYCFLDEKWAQTWKLNRMRNGDC